MKLSINQCAAAINAVGQHTTVLIEGPSGSGKSSILGMLNMPAHRKVYIDCTQIDVGDIQIPSVNHATGTSTFYPNEVFGVHSDEPVVICLDEFGKAPRSVQNALLPVVLDRRVGTRPLPAGSVVFATTNLSSEGVGDTLQLHVRNRMSVIAMRKPTVEEYVNYSLANDGNPAVLAWVQETPQVLADDDTVANPDQNPYIWHRKDPGRKAFCSPRSMTAAGRVLNDAEHLDDDTMRGLLAGLIGARAAADLHVFVQMGNKLPSWKAIVTSPLQAPVPDTPTMCMMLVHRAITRTTQDTLDPVMAYMKRLPMELQAVFVNQFLRIPQRAKFAALNKSFTNWCTANNWIMG
jgi:energy-coupling factor transporter ATP-binding protein EcfA2